MLYRSLLILAMTLFLLLPTKFFSLAENNNFCDKITILTPVTPATPLTQHIACMHKRLNQHTNKVFHQLNLFYKSEFSPNQRADVFKNLGMYDFKAGPPTKPHTDLIAACDKKIKVGATDFINLSPQCLLSHMLFEFHHLDSKVPTDDQFWPDHIDTLFQTFQTTTNIYNQMLMAYPMHLEYEQLYNELSKFMDEFKKSTSKLQSLPNKFSNAATTECQ